MVGDNTATNPRHPAIPQLRLVHETWYKRHSNRLDNPRARTRTDTTGTILFLVLIISTYTCKRTLAWVRWLQLIPLSEVMSFFVQEGQPSTRRADYVTFPYFSLHFLSCLHCLFFVKGHREVKIEENTSFGKLVKPFQIW